MVSTRLVSASSQRYWMVTDSFMIPCFQWVQCWQQGCGWLRQIRLLSPQFAQGSFQMGEWVFPMVFSFLLVTACREQSQGFYGVPWSSIQLFPVKLRSRSANFFYGNNGLAFASCSRNNSEHVGTTEQLDFKMVSVVQFIRLLPAHSIHIGVRFWVVYLPIWLAAGVKGSIVTSGAV